MGSFVARHGMTSARSQSEFNSLLGQGYRLVEVSGYGVGSQALYAAIWDKTAGPAWEAHHGMTSSDYQTRFNQLVGQGFRLRQVSGYRSATRTSMLPCGTSRRARPGKHITA